ncbi:MAG: DUF2436 domain-containing protein [Muribaculaceae bacterium]|nr:DUF2436 domain-containing protein [Muribaculaceae bacterium]
MKHLLKLFLIVVVAMAYSQYAAAQDVTKVDGDKALMAKDNAALINIIKARLDAEPYKVVPNRASVPEGYARVTLAVGIRWVDGYGYQMLLDKDHSAYTFRLSNYSNQLGGYLTTANYGSINNYNNYNRAAYGSDFLNNFYNEFEYKIPELANAAQGTSNVVLDEPGSILIPAGTYDFAITVPATYLLMASNHGQVQRSEWNDFEFESGKSYVFNVLGVQENGTSYDAVFLEISAPYMALLSGDGAFGDVKIGEAKTVTITVMNTGEEAFTPVVNCDNPAFTISSTSSGKLASGASRSYVVTFAPTELQSYSGTFTLNAQELTSMDFEYTTQLSGVGVGEEHQGDPSGGNNQSSMFPVYGEYFTTQGTTSQMIYPASMLTAQGIKAGDAITALTFYVQGNGTVPTQLGNATVAMSLGNTDATTVTSQSGMETNRSNSTQVFNGNLTTGQNTLTINLSAPYQYLGDNLIVDFVVGSSNTSQSCSWVGENNHSNASYCTYYRYWTRTSQGSFLPKISIAYSTMPELEATTSLDFGTVSVGDGEAKTAIVKNEGNADVQATITVNDNPPFSVASSAITIGANSFAIIPVTFMPNAEDDYTGTLTIVAGNETINIPLTGKGVYTGPEAIRDNNFFDGITYKWPINADEEDQTESTLAEIATDPEQIIAMLREVYTNKDIPGNYYRGHTATGGKDHDNEVPYTGVGMITSNSSTVCEDSYGWDIPGDVLDGSNYRYMDPNQYKPNEEGVTLLLIEMVDDFKKPSNMTQATTTYEELKDYIGMSIKSARIISEARRTGEGIERGTLFKIDCDKMNKFYLLAKGQLLWFDNQKSTIGYGNPAYYNGTYYDEGLAFDYLNGPALLCHMFEQFSPTVGNAEEAEADLYWDLIDMKSFGVIHDCPNVPFVQNGHHFMMYGEDSQSADCQDVRDMMFFVPDFRMLEHLNRGSGGLSENRSQDYFRYNTKHQPTMGLFVIHQDEIPDGTIVKENADMTGLYKHQLAWKSNLDDFLPGEYQYYELWELVVDEFGIESYVPVYYRNANGEYTDAAGSVVSTPVPIILPRIKLAVGEEGFTWPDVYVDMTAGSQTRTYVIRGRDSDGFLTLQMSNPEEIFIPGLDPNEKARMIGATYYSRYNPDNEKNCYSNRLELSNNGMTLTSTDLSKGLKFYRSSRAAQVDENGNAVTDANGNIQYLATVNKELVATGAVEGSNIRITLSNQSQSTDYPNGKTSGTAAGYHTNATLSFPFTTSEGVVNLTNGLRFWDNFTVEVSKNAHPLQYMYKMEVGEEGQEGYAYSNEVRVPIYKTDSKINGSFTKAQVDGETGNVPTVEVVEDVEFQEKVQFSSKQDILRYDAYRWSAKAANEHYFIVNTVDGDDEGDLPPDGIAGNQGEYYTVTMNDDDDALNYYVAPTSAQPRVNEQNTTNWANFIDYYPKNQTSAIDYVYAPVVELFSRGYQEQLDENGNKVARIDYNTYGGPQQSKAVGKFPLATPSYAKSAYTWPGDKTKPQYCYYDVKLQFSNAAVPAGYELYKVRAWRQIPTKYVGEEEDDYQYRLGAEIDGGMNSFKFDEITYTGEASNPCHIGTSSSDLGVMGYTLGQNKDSNNVYNYTFGARKVGTGDNVTNGIDIASLPVKFIVRAYFTKTNNLNGSKAGGDDKFYIVETVIEDEIKDTENVITEVNDLSAIKVVSDVIYFDTMGRASSRPHNGVNIVVTRYTDGTTSTTKVVK